MRRCTALLLLGVLALPGCPAEEPDPSRYPRDPALGTSAAGWPEQPGPGPASRPSTPPVFVATVSSPGTATFAVEGTGLVRLRDGTFSVLQEVPGMIRAIAPGKEGLWVSNYSGLYLLRPGQRPQKLGALDNPGSVEELAVARDGTLWTLGYLGVGRYDGKELVLFDRSRFGNAGLLRALAVDGAGRAWVVTSEALWVQEGGRWKALETAVLTGPRPFFDRIVSSPDGKVYVAYLGGLLRCDPRGCVKHAELADRPACFAIAPDGRMLLVARLNRISLLSAKKVQRPIDPGEAGFRASAVRAVTADAAGRFWLATDYGLVILDSEGKAVQWEPGQVKEIAGQVQAIAVEGEGPNLPAVGPRPRLVVKGRVLRGGAPVSGARVEICESPSLSAGGPPCAGSSFRQSAETDEHGSFSLPDVPLGAYRFAIKAGHRWVITLGRDCCLRTDEGPGFDVGTLTLRER